MKRRNFADALLTGLLATCLRVAVFTAWAVFVLWVLRIPITPDSVLLWTVANLVLAANLGDCVKRAAKRHEENAK